MINSKQNVQKIAPKLLNVYDVCMGCSAPIPVGNVAHSEQFLILMLRRPGVLIWPDDGQKLSSIREICRTTLPESSHAFLDLSIFTSLLVDKERYLHILKSDLCRLLPDLPGFEKYTTEQQARSTTWTAVPVAGVPLGGQAGAVITWYILGCLDEESGSSYSQSWPDWAENRMDDKALQAIEDAFLAARRATDRNKQFFIFPLCEPVNGPPLQGRSLGLPVALAATSLLQNIALKTNFLATGDINGEGEILSVNVNTIPEKILAAKNEEFPLFLYPMNNRLPENTDHSLYTKPVASLRQARIWADCFSPAMAHDVQRLDTALQNSRDLVNNIDELRPEFLEWIHSTGIAAALFDEICNSADLCWNLANDKLNSILEKADGDYLLPGLVANLITDEEQIHKMGTANEAAALSWCSSHVALANHCGAIKKAHFWCQQGNKWVDDAVKKDEGRRLYYRFINRCFGISKRHNAYHFSPDLPEKFTTLLKNKEKQHQTVCELGPCSDYALGSLYGTAGQNYAFCRSDYLEQSKEYFAKAKAAFGPEDTQNCRREDSSLFFALLDSHKESAAEEAMQNLLSSFGLAKADDINYEEGLIPFQHFALLRAILEIPNQFSPILRENLTNLAFAKFGGFNEHGHPWQLWCYNLGRLAVSEKKPELARKAWEKSCELCRQGDETIQIMALLPLAALRTLEREPVEIEKQAGEILQLIKKSGEIHQAHFKPLLEKTTQGNALEQVTENPSRFFPFNYR